MNAPRIPRLPYGCDQQGRHPEAADWPDTEGHAADLERQAMLARQVQDCDQRLDDLDASRGVVHGLLLSLALVGAAALLVHFLAA